MAVRQTLQKVPSEHVQPNLIIRHSYDLLLLVGLGLLLPGLVSLPIPLLPLPLGLAAVLLAPGYALTAALFPRRADLHGAERAAFSFGLSVAVLPVLTLVLNALPWGIHPWPIALALSLWLWLLSGVALWRRRRAATAGAAYRPPMVNPGAWWRSLSDRANGSYAIGALMLTGTLLWAAFILFPPNPTARVTEFYALGVDGLAENYPRELALDQEMQVQVGIRNHEGGMARYRIEVRAEGNLLAQTEPLILEDGVTWEGSVRYKLARVGNDQRVEILLFYNDDPKPYRQLRLWVNVRAGQ